ncbi:MAG TPA: hypothetical protein ENI27_06040 [bacterium]|nr:hypothetical protein [bacterium]
MPVIPIFDPTKGMFTAADQQDLDPRAGFADLIENLYLDRPGKIRKRDMLDNWLPSGNAVLLKGFFRFVDENLTGNAEWIAYGSLSGNDVIHAASVSTFTSRVSGLTQVATGKLDTTVVAGKLRLAFGYTSHRWYGYNDINDFFQDQYQPSSAWAWQTRQPSYPSTFTYTSLTLVDANSGLGEVALGYSYYKAVPIFDGVQEGLFATGRAFIDTTDTIAAAAFGVLMLKMTFDSDDWNKRITHLNIYRNFDSTSADDDDALYQKVDTISVRNDDAPTTITDAQVMNRLLYDKSKSWSVNAYVFSGTGSLGTPDVDDIKYVLVWGVSDADILSNTAKTLTLNTDMNLLDKSFTRFAYTISKRVCTSGGTWVGATATNEDTGTNGWGGWWAIYLPTSSFGEDEIKYNTLQYNTEGTDVWGVIYANTDKVISISKETTVPVSGSGLSIIYAKYLYFKTGTVYDLYWCDYGRLNKGAHPLAGVTSITSAPKYSVFWKGRLFGLNTRVTKADNTTEDFPDALVYTEVNQLDVWPADFQLQQPTDQGGIGQGLEVIEEIETLILFFRNSISFLKVPQADPDSWRMWSSTRAIGLVNPDAVVKTPVGIFFCSDEGIYLIDKGGRISSRPVSFPIYDSYLSAVDAGVTKFSAIYYPQQRQVWFNFLASPTEIWALDIDTVNWDVPRWSKNTWGSSRLVHLSAVDESNKLYLFNYGVSLLSCINRIGSSITGDESAGTTFRTSYMALGSMQRKHLIRRAIVGHKGAQAITPTVYLNDGAESEAKTAIAASANGEHKKIKIKRYARNFALQLVSAAATSIVHEITGIEMEVGDE